MQIVITSRTDEDGASAERMEIDGKYALSVQPLCECPEDATLERDLVSCSDVLRFMQRAYEAGKSGEELNVELRGFDG